MHVDIRKSFSLLAFCLVVGLFSPVIVSFLDRGFLATSVAVIGWVCFVIIAAYYPIFSIQQGVIWSKTSVTYRTEKPIRFWVGLVTLEILILCFLLLATISNQPRFCNDI